MRLLSISLENVTSTTISILEMSCRENPHGFSAFQEIMTPLNLAVLICHAERSRGIPFNFSINNHFISVKSMRDLFILDHRNGLGESAFLHRIWLQRRRTGTSSRDYLRRLLLLQGKM